MPVACCGCKNLGSFSSLPAGDMCLQQGDLEQLSSRGSHKNCAGPSKPRLLLLIQLFQCASLLQAQAKKSLRFMLMLPLIKPYMRTILQPASARWQQVSGTSEFLLTSSTANADSQ